MTTWPDVRGPDDHLETSWPFGDQSTHLPLPPLFLPVSFVDANKWDLLAPRYHSLLPRYQLVLKQRSFPLVLKNCMFFPTIVKTWKLILLTSFDDEDRRLSPILDHIFTFPRNMIPYFLQFCIKVFLWSFYQDLPKICCPPNDTSNTSSFLIPNPQSPPLLYKETNNTSAHPWELWAGGSNLLSTVPLNVVRCVEIIFVKQTSHHQTIVLLWLDSKTLVCPVEVLDSPPLGRLVMARLGIDFHTFQYKISNVW